jgi:hypothetical protein
MSLYKAFNNVFISLLEDCILVFPNDSDFKKYRKGANILNEFNPRKPASIYKEYSSMFREQINNKDETFFLNNDYSDLKEVQEDNDVIAFINKIKGCWVQLSDDNKGKIWQYLQTLCTLADKI